LLPGFAAILSFKLAELDLLTEADGRPPLLLLDDVFSELDPDRRAHLVRRIEALPQAFVTTTTLDDLDPALRAIGTTWEVRAEADGARLIPGPGAPARATTGP
jgi:DNA replication and repair protein RecF